MTLCPLQPQVDGQSFTLLARGWSLSSALFTYSENFTSPVLLGILAHAWSEQPLDSQHLPTAGTGRVSDPLVPGPAPRDSDAIVLRRGLGI